MSSSVSQLPRGERRSRLIRTVSAIAVLSALLLAASAQSSQGLPPGRAAHPIVVIVMENHEYSQIAGASSAPYINRLIAKGRLFSAYDAVTHPSLPNYLAMTSGSTQAMDGSDTVSAGQIRSDNLFHQLSRAGVSWRAFMGSMPSPCYKPYAAGVPPGDYELKHNPALTYHNVAMSKLCRKVVPLRQLFARALPRFSFVAPNQCDDMHSCSVQTGDEWLADFVPKLLARGTTVVVTFDEGTSDAGGGGRVVTVEVGRGIGAATNGSPFTHYGLLAGLEKYFHLERLGAAKTARPLPLG